VAAELIDLGAKRRQPLCAARVLPGSRIVAQAEKDDGEDKGDGCGNCATGGHGYSKFGSRTLRPTELQGAFGIHQVPRLERFIQIRRENAEYWNGALRKYSEWLRLSPGREGQGSRSVWFGYPITVRPSAPFSREDLVRFLEAQA